MILGIDIGGTGIKAGLVDEKGRILAFKTVPTPTRLDALRDNLKKLIQELTEAQGPLQGVGFGCKGIINPHTTAVETLPGTFQFLEGTRLSSIVESALPAGIPVFAGNDAHVALAGECMWGAARGHKNVLMLTLGTGVGGALLADGQILRGARGVAGHLGHVTVSLDGPLCSCGNRGCLETFFSALAIEAEALAAIHRGCESILTERFKDCPETLSCQVIFETAAEGDPLAQQIIKESLRFLGGAIAGMAHSFDPELIILGGQIIKAGPILFESVQQEVWWRSRRLLAREIPIVPQQVADRSGVVGAAALVLTSIA